MKFKQVCFLAMGMLAGCASQAGKNQASVPMPREPGYLFTIENDAVPSAEFVHILSKNPDPLTKVEYDQNFKLFLHYKLKVKEAERLGMDQREEFKRELDEIKEELKKSFLQENPIQEEVLREAYARSREMIKASHILLRFPPNASSADSLAVLRMAEIVREKALNGADFNSLALQYSEDPSAESNKGSLGYFTAFQMVQPFEEAAFALSPGGISDPVLTSYGYHLIKLEDRRSNPGEMKVSHILIKVDPSNPDSDRLAKRKISEIHALLQKKAGDWQEFVLTYSEDQNSKYQEGKLPWFGLGSMAPEFELMAFSLDKIGEISPPVKTQYGYHIIKLEDIRPIPPFEEIKGDLQSKIQKFNNTSIKEAEDKNLINQNKEYRLLVNEYREGILLFNLMNELVWQKAALDSVGQRTYFETHADRYQWAERIPALIIKMEKEEPAAKVRGFLSDKTHSPNLKQKLEEEFLIEDPLLFVVEQDLFTIEGHSILSKIDINKKYHELFLDEKYYFVVLGDVVPEGPKRFEETRGLVLQDYQKHLDSVLVETLLNKYSVQINEVEKE